MGIFFFESSLYAVYPASSTVTVNQQKVQESSISQSMSLDVSAGL